MSDGHERWMRGNKAQRRRWANERAEMTLHLLGMRCYEFHVMLRAITPWLAGEFLKMSDQARRALNALDATKNAPQERAVKSPVAGKAAAHHSRTASAGGTHRRQV